MKNSKSRFITLTSLLSMATIIIHFVNKIIAASASLKDILKVSNNNIFRWRFGDIYYTKKGKGSPVLLIHDSLPGSSGYEWNRIENELQKNHTVYNLDLLGFGRSEKPGITYTNFIFVQVINDFIRSIIDEKTDVISSGFSCSFVTMACRQEKDLYNRIVFVNPPNLKTVNRMPSDKDKLFKLMLELPVFGTLVYHMIVSQEHIRNQFIENLYFDPFHLDQDILDAHYEGSHKGGYYAKNLYASFIGKYMNINIESSLKTINNSIFIIEGSEEPSNLMIVDSYKKINPAIESTIIENTKHFPQIEKSGLFIKQLELFLQ